VIAFPTDTVYGLGALARDPQACQCIFAIKHRDQSQQLIMMAAEVEQLTLLAVFDDRAQALAEHWWPGPLTLVLPARQGPPSTLGVRIPDHALALALLREVGEPLATTSANLSGEAPAMNAEEAARLDGLTAVLDGGRAPGGQPSTVVSVVEPSIKVLREGPISSEELT
jgi:L-threonylcarbamoyladenylate synthase